MDRADLALQFASNRPPRFDELVDEIASVVPFDLVASGYYPAFAASSRASYVLALGDSLAYPSLRVADGFGTVGRLDLVLRDNALASTIDAALTRHDLGEALRVHRGTPAQIVPGINGPYDLVLAALPPPQLDDLYEPIVRLLRTGGALVVAPWDRTIGEGDAVPGEADFLNRLADDARLLAYLPATESPLIAVRRR